LFDHLIVGYGHTVFLSGLPDYIDEAGELLLDTEGNPFSPVIVRINNRDIDVNPKTGRALTRKEMQDLYQQDLETAIGRAESTVRFWAGKKVGELAPGTTLADLTPSQKNLLIDMSFQLGNGLRKYRKLAAAINNGDAEGINRELEVNMVNPDDPDGPKIPVGERNKIRREEFGARMMAEIKLQDFTDTVSKDDPEGTDPRTEPNKFSPLTDEIIGQTPEGRNIFRNEDGTFSSERTSTAPLPNGKWINFPTIFKGKELNQDKALDIIINNNLVDPETRQKLPTFDSESEASAAAKAKSRSIETPSNDATLGDEIIGNLPTDKDAAEFVEMFKMRPELLDQLKSEQVTFSKLLKAGKIAKAAASQPTLMRLMGEGMFGAGIIKNVGKQALGVIFKATSKGPRDTRKGDVFEFKINKDGKDIGGGSLSIDGATANIDNINIKGGPNSQGVSGMRDLIDAVTTQFPQVDKLTGLRSIRRAKTKGTQEVPLKVVEGGSKTTPKRGFSQGTGKEAVRDINNQLKVTRDVETRGKLLDERYKLDPDGKLNYELVKENMEPVLKEADDIARIKAQERKELLDEAADIIERKLKEADKAKLKKALKLIEGGKDK